MVHHGTGRRPSPRSRRTGRRTTARWSSGGSTLIESNKFIRLLEKPEYKRRWATEPWEKQVERALRGWLLDRLEDRRFWFDAQGRPQVRSVGQLADQVSRDADLVSVLELWSGRKDQSVTRVA